VTKHLLDENDVLRAERCRGGRGISCILSVDRFLRLHEVVDRAGGQSAWARQTGVDRVHLNKVLRGKRPFTRSVLQALKLREVYTAHRLLR
jgi:hypothetical protein